MPRQGMYNNSVKLLLALSILLSLEVGYKTMYSYHLLKD